MSNLVDVIIHEELYCSDNYESQIPVFRISIKFFGLIYIKL